MNKSKIQVKSKSNGIKSKFKSWTGASEVHQTVTGTQGKHPSQKEIPDEIDLIEIVDNEEIIYSENKDKDEGEINKPSRRVIDLREAESIGDSMDVLKREGDI